MKVKDVYKREYAEYFKETLTSLWRRPAPAAITARSTRF